MALWRKLTFEWPVALNNWLWGALVVRPAEFLNDWTLKRFLREALWKAALLLLVIGFAQASLPLEIAFLLAGDTLFYLEVITAVWFVTARGHLRAVLQMAEHAVRGTRQRISGNLARHRLAARQRRNVNALKRKRPYTGPLSSEDEPALFAWPRVSFAAA